MFLKDLFETPPNFILFFTRSCIKIFFTSSTNHYFTINLVTLCVVATLNGTFRTFFLDFKLILQIQKIVKINQSFLVNRFEDDVDYDPPDVPGAAVDGTARQAELFVRDRRRSSTSPWLLR